MIGLSCADETPYFFFFFFCGVGRDLNDGRGLNIPSADPIIPCCMQWEEGRLELPLGPADFTEYLASLFISTAYRSNVSMRNMTDRLHAHLRGTYLGYMHMHACVHARDHIHSHLGRLGRDMCPRLSQLNSSFPPTDTLACTQYKVTGQRMG